ncbi:MAG TPA: DUF2336 domain-containing protein [Rhizomicrobium sp.]|nr:DUF2336 domain-containing protein [Rhizomicrobium sp.]
MQLAVNPQNTNREDIYLAVASLYRMQGPALSPRERSLMREILQRLALDVEMAIRIQLAEKLADDEDAPLDLILLLVDDKIEVARPIIMRSAKLSEENLLALLQNADTQVQAACAERPNIGEPVTDFLARSDAEPVLMALVRNLTARIAPATFEMLAEKSRGFESLQEPLTRRTDLPSAIATRMCEWVSDALKHHLIQTHNIAPAIVDKAAQAISTPAPQAANASESARKLVDKLAAANQLRAGFLLRTLHQGQIDLFETAFAKLLTVEIPEVREILYSRGARSVALACRAVGIDKCVFATVFNLSRQARGTSPTISATDKGDAEAIFTGFSKTEALQRLHTPAQA